MVFLLTAPSAFADMPFWAEKSAFTQGDRVYFVGVSTQAKSIEEGRAKALESARHELSQYLRAIDTSVITLESQMTYQCINPNGTYNVYRLTFAYLAQLTAFKRKALDAERASIELERIEVAKQLAANRTLIADLKAQRAEAQNQEVAATTIRRQLISKANILKRRVACGMTREQLIKVMGNPDTTENESANGKWVKLAYGRYWVGVEGGIVGCVFPVGYALVHTMCDDIAGSGCYRGSF